MIPQPGQHVKLLFTTGQSAEGFVESWSDDKSVLISEADTVMIVNKTSQNVMAVILTKKLPLKQAVEEYEELVDTPKEKLNLKRLAELKAQLNEQEREDHFNKLKSHEFTNITPVRYANITVPKESRLVKHSSSKNTRENVRHNPIMRAVLRDKNKSNG